MEKHKCKTCSRSFSNGRALGGHMRSHMVNQFNKSKTEQPMIGNEDNSSFQSSSSSKFEETLETECSKNPEIWMIKAEIREKDSIVSVTETNPDEEIAYCLMMLKRDSWERGDIEKQSVSTKSKGKYKCDDCGKAFKSYQALGGHRASHKKGLITNRKFKSEEMGIEEIIRENNHQCSVCSKVFSSGQALGGHKRSHFLEVADDYRIDSANKKIKSLIDLNLPPAVDDDDDDNEISQIVSQS